MPVVAPALAVLTAPLALQLSPGTIWIVVPAPTPLRWGCGRPANFWPRSNDQEPVPTFLIRTALKVRWTRVGGASRQTSLVWSDGALERDAASQPFASLRSAFGSSQPS